MEILGKKYASALFHIFITSPYSQTHIHFIFMSLSVKEVKGLLDKSCGEIIGFTKMFPVEPALENFTKFLTESQKNIEAYYPQIDQLDFYRYFCRDY